MPAECSSCRNTKTIIMDSRRLLEGGRWRRHRCLACDYRWSSWEGNPPNRNGPRRSYKKLTTDAVRLILTSTLSASKLAKQLGCSKQAICAVRTGISHSQKWPELPRLRNQQRLSCFDCHHWAADVCGLGFPDPLDEGAWFANDCVNYCNKSLE